MHWGQSDYLRMHESIRGACANGDCMRRVFLISYISIRWLLRLSIVFGWGVDSSLLAVAGPTFASLGEAGLFPSQLPNQPCDMFPIRFFAWKLTTDALL